MFMLLLVIIVSIACGGILILNLRESLEIPLEKRPASWTKIGWGAGFLFTIVICATADQAASAIAGSGIGVGTLVFMSIAFGPIIGAISIASPRWMGWGIGFLCGGAIGMVVGVTEPFFTNVAIVTGSSIIGSIVGFWIVRLIVGIPTVD